jgi:hypothetical protein
VSAPGNGLRGPDAATRASRFEGIVEPRVVVTGVPSGLERARALVEGLGDSLAAVVLDASAQALDGACVECAEWTRCALRERGVATVLVLADEVAILRAAELGFRGRVATGLAAALRGAVSTAASAHRAV